MHEPVNNLKETGNVKDSGGKLYSPGYEDASLRGDEETRPWSVTEVISSYTRPDTVLLDIGCGSCRKTLPLARGLHRMYGLDPSSEMRSLAQIYATQMKVDNLYLVDGVAENIPFSNDMFDVVTCILAPHTTSEVHRVLKRGGVAIVEKLGDRDKVNIKECFGEDGLGPRGQFLGIPMGERKRQYQEEFDKLFTSASIRLGEWGTYLTPDGLIKLLQETNTVREFDINKDRECIDRLVAQLATPKGIPTTHQRLLIVAIK